MRPREVTYFTQISRFESDRSRIGKKKEKESDRGRIESQAASLQSLCSASQKLGLYNFSSSSPERTLITSVPQFPSLQDGEKDPSRKAGVNWACGSWVACGHVVCIWAETPTGLPLASPGSSGPSLREASSTLPTA